MLPFVEKKKFPYPTRIHGAAAQKQQTVPILTVVRKPYHVFATIRSQMQAKSMSFYSSCSIQ
jgi:hypothetical protein